MLRAHGFPPFSPDGSLAIAVFAEEDGVTVKHLLRENYGVSAAVLREWKAHPRGILCNGEACTVRRVLQAGDVLTLAACRAPTPLKQCTFSGGSQTVPILFADAWVLAVNKPAGMPTHPSAGHRGDTLLDLISAALPPGEKVYPINRLDRDTSGVVLLSRHKLAACVLSVELQTGGMQKEYCAVTAQPLPAAHGVMRDGMAREADSIIRRTVVLPGDGEDAFTEYRMVGVRNGRYCFRLYPKTGRTHQLRVQLAHRGAPIVGDTLYGGDPAFARQALHAERLTFFHPCYGRMTVVAQMPQDMREIWKEDAGNA